jgi:50S ribosomal protein L16 3-hydroxylase
MVRVLCYNQPHKMSRVVRLHMTKITMLGGMSYHEFLRDYWQKKPLLIRQAFPNFQNTIKKNDLFLMASQDDVLSRLIKYEQNQWQLFDGPMPKAKLKKAQGLWTLLVQGVNYLVPEVQAILNKFNFIPYARLDDVMISYAISGAGVGPHFDSYDVFLLQGEGKRLWQTSAQKDQTLLSEMPVKILKKFKPTQEWILEPGDMLYLPPNYAHNGVAIGESITYSIGFRAPSYQELTTEFLGFLQEHNCMKGIYQDPDLKYTKEAARIPATMIAHVSDLIHKVKWDKKNITEFLGVYLTQPKAHIFFDSPEDAMTKKQFIKHLRQYGIRLHAKTQMLYQKDSLFINGECISLNEKIFKDLANNRYIEVLDTINSDISDLFYQWYLEGYIETQSMREAFE